MVRAGFATSSRFGQCLGAGPIRIQCGQGMSAAHQGLSIVMGVPRWTAGWFRIEHMGMDQYLLIPFFGG